MAITVPPVPVGVIDPENLYNEGYADLPKLVWADVTFHDKLLWLSEQQKFSIKSWYATRNVSPDTNFLLPTQFTVVLPNGNTYEVDCRNVVLNSDLLLYTFQGLEGAVQTQAKYPGYESRHPAEGGSPIGKPLLKQPWPGRVLYEDLLPAAYAVGAVFPEPDGDKFTKVKYVVTPGGGPFGTGAVYGTAWERTYKG